MQNVKLRMGLCPIPLYNISSILHFDFSFMISTGVGEFLKKQREIFDREYSNTSDESSGLFRFVRPYVNHLIADFVSKTLKDKSNVLDVGCGDGFILKHISNGISSATGIDLSQVAIVQARKLLGGDSRIRLHQSLFEDFSSDEQFDAILMLDVFEHFMDADFVLRKCRYLLRDNGILIISTPNRKRLTNVIKRLAKVVRGDATGIGLIESHFREYSLSEIKDILNRYGFSIKRVEANTILDLKYMPALLLNKGQFVRMMWSAGRVFPTLASNYNIVAEKR